MFDHIVYADLVSGGLSLLADFDVWFYLMFVLALALSLVDMALSWWRV